MKLEGGITGEDVTGAVHGSYDITGADWRLLPRLIRFALAREFKRLGIRAKVTGAILKVDFAGERKG